MEEDGELSERLFHSLCGMMVESLAFFNAR